MAQKVTIQVLGGQPKTVDGVSTVSEAARILGITDQTRQVMVNGQVASYGDYLEDYSFVSFSDAKKGG